MNKTFLLVLVNGLVALGCLPPAANAEMLQSPDGKVTITIELKDGMPFWGISYGKKPITRDGRLGVETGPIKFAENYNLLGAETASGDSTWKAVWGNLSEVRDHYNQLTVKLQETGGKGRMLNIILRAYNEGVACRYEFPQQPGLPEVEVKKRLTQFRFLDNHVVYDTRDYRYGTGRIDSLAKKSECAVALDIGDGNFVALTDADRSNFSQVFWVADKASPNTITGTLAGSASGKTPFSTSWEVMVIGETLGKLYENRFLIDNLNPPCALADTSWIKSGPALCQIRNGRMVTADLKKVMAFASAHNMPYMEIDHSWNGAETKWTAEEIANFEKNMGPFWKEHPEWRQNVVGNPMVAAKGYVPFRPHSYQGGNLVDLDVAELVAYGKSLTPPVGVCVYVRGGLFKEFGGEYPIADVFAAYAKMGIVGVKPGFVPAATQYNEQVNAYMVRKAAENKLIAVVHDAWYPYGLSRTYPNLLNVEGGAGDEAEHSIPQEKKSVHDIMLVFTRMIMGPFDYTPEIGRKGKTHCHQVAMVGIYHGRPSIRGGTGQWAPGGENPGGEVEFIAKWPGVFDEMKVQAEANESITVARRRADNWYVASMAGPKGRSYSYPMRFLKPGVSYNAIVFSDTPGKQEATRSTHKVTSESTIQIAMEPNGGHLMIIEPEK